MAQNFEDLEIWKKAHELTREIYKLTTGWPKSETYSLTSQIRRAAVSVELNIAEGHSRYHYNDTMKFLYDSRASAAEVRNCLMIARDLPELTLTDDKFSYFNVEYIGLIKGINGFIGHLKRRKLVS